MIDLDEVKDAIDYTLGSVKRRCSGLGKRLLRHWYDGCALAGTCADANMTDPTMLAEFARKASAAMLAALDKESRE